MTIVTDYETLECRFRDESSTMLLDLKVNAQWTQTDGDILDQISAGSMITTVTSEFEPENNYELRMRFKPDGGSWGAWSSWGTGRVEHDIDVPSAGNDTQDDYDAELRRVGSTSTIATSGYVKVKKLSSGS